MDTQFNQNSLVVLHSELASLKALMNVNIGLTRLALLRSGMDAAELDALIKDWLDKFPKESGRSAIKLMADVFSRQQTNE